VFYFKIETTPGSDPGNGRVEVVYKIVRLTPWILGVLALAVLFERWMPLPYAGALLWLWRILGGLCIAYVGTRALRAIRRKRLRRPDVFRRWVEKLERPLLSTDGSAYEQASRILHGLAFVPGYVQAGGPLVDRWLALYEQCWEMFDRDDLGVESPDVPPPGVMLLFQRAVDAGLPKPPVFPWGFGNTYIVYDWR
jgi:hypothetical protein